MTFSDLFQRMHRQSPSPVAVVDATGQWTYRQLLDRANRLTNALAATGLRRGDRVVVLLGDKREHLEVIVALLLGGLVRVPLNPASTSHEVRACMVDCDPRAVIHDEELTSVVASASEGIDLGAQVVVGPSRTRHVRYEQLLDQASSRAANPVIEQDSLASLNYSGGTTGAPKAVMLTHGNLLAAIRSSLAGRTVHQADIFLNVRPLWPIASIVLLFQLAAGAGIALGGKFDPQRYLSLMASHGATSSSLVPTQLKRLLDALRQAPPKADLTARRIDVGGAPLPPESFAEAVEILGPIVGVLYGLTEAPWTCYLTPQEVADANEPQRAEIMSSVGRPMPGNSISLLTDDATSGSETAVEGEVMIRGGHVMQGYWRRPDDTAAVMRNGWLLSGDIGRLDGEGRLHLTGRSKEVIKSGAMSVNPREVEEVLMRHPAVADVAVYGVPDPDWGEAVKAAVVVEAGHEVSEEELVIFCRERLASFKKPRMVDFVSSIPRSHYGKILKKQLS